MDDLRIAWVGDCDQRIGMTVLPGRKLIRPDGLATWRDRDSDLAQMSVFSSTLVLLVTDEELGRDGATDIVERGLRQGVHVFRRPIISGRSVPTWLMEEVASWGQQPPVVYACTSGHGRSAVAAGWALVLRGATAQESIDQVRRARGVKALASSFACRSVADLASHLARQPINLGSWFPTIPTVALRRAHLPPPRAPWSLLAPFAMSFDGYDHAGSPDKLQRLWARVHDAFVDSGSMPFDLSVSDGRACVFALQRAVHWRLSDAGPDYDPYPTADEYSFIWALVEWLRLRTERA